MVAATLPPGDELEFRFVRASGPGGQNVNKVSTAVQLRWRLVGTRALDADALARLRQLAKNRISQEGVLVLDARGERSQAQNREDALARLAQLIEQARRKPKIRRPTKVTRAAKERRLEHKRRHSQIKKTRRGEW